MGLVELIILSVGLAMDAFAVSICKGLAMKKMKWKNAIIIGLYFGIFQAIMPLIGYLLGVRFQSAITSIDHWVAFVLLVGIGANMIREAMSKEKEEASDSIKVKDMLILAIATSIDALSVGITFSFFKINLVKTIITIGITCFILSLLGCFIGKVIGNKINNLANIIGGIILILIGLKILLEHFVFL